MRANLRRNSTLEMMSALPPPVSADFLEREVLRPFTIADTFIPGSGLELNWPNA